MVGCQVRLTRQACEEKTSIKGGTIWQHIPSPIQHAEMVSGRLGNRTRLICYLGPRPKRPSVPLCSAMPRAKLLRCVK